MEFSPKPVNSKVDFVRRYSIGEFGNASPTWDNNKKWLRDVWGDIGAAKSVDRTLYHIRNRVAGGQTWYSVPGGDLFNLWNYITDPGFIVHIRPEDLYISEMAPHDKGTIQGEIMQDESHLYLRYNFQKLPMREGFAVENLHAWGIEATNLLRHYLCPNSWEWVNILLDRYPGHVIEFSSFSVNWGTLPGFNTVFWEIRGGY